MKQNVKSFTLCKLKNSPLLFGFVLKVVSILSFSKTSALIVQVKE